MVQQIKSRPFTSAAAPKVIGNITLINSSFIEQIDYNMLTKTLIVVIDGKMHFYKNINYRKYSKFIQGRAICLTNDPTGLNRWHKGKTPSLGAYYNQFIKLGGVKGVRIARVASAHVARKRRKKVSVGLYRSCKKCGNLVQKGERCEYCKEERKRRS